MDGSKTVKGSRGSTTRRSGANGRREANVRRYQTKYTRARFASLREASTGAPRQEGDSPPRKNGASRPNRAARSPDSNLHDVAASEPPSASPRYPHAPPQPSADQAS